MTTSVALVRYSRPVGALWRDTGEHVVVLSRTAGTDVKVLGGGGAVVWRILERPHTLSDLMTTFATVEAGAPAEEVVRDCLEELHTQGLIEAEELL